jgi:pyruvate formate lyase activating enzyme
MNIKGLFKTSLIDFPGKVSAVVFFGGCNLSCCYCHNPLLARDSDILPVIEQEEILSFLQKRVNLIDALTISGGEPTLDKELLSFMKKVKDMGFLIKLDTNGLRPDILKLCLEKNLVDYIALDLKTSPAKYSDLCRVNVNTEAILFSLNLIRESSVQYEVRTTCVPQYVMVDDIHEIGNFFGSVSMWYLQQFVNTAELLDPETQRLSPYPRVYLELMKKAALNFAEQCVIRGL